jgi:glycosyltransferase involved in cell wall biosynthesis
MIVCPSRFMKEQLDSQPILRKKTVFLQNFVDIEARATIYTGGASPSPTTYIAPVGADVHIRPPEAPYVLYFGRYSPEKGLATLLKVAKSLPDIPFVFAGSGPLEAQVNALPNGTNKGFLHGEVLTDTVNRAKFVVFPSEWYENCPLSVMEALALGTPVLAADSGGTPDLIEAGVNGELFTSGNARELRDKIRQLWDSPAKERVTTTFMSTTEYCQKLVAEVYI